LSEPAAIAAIDCPVLCLYGGESAVRELAAETASALPRSRHVVVAGFGHTLLIDAPDQVRAEVLDWLVSYVH
jgi:pimeloyl-ACP methyl ester carboxylesterase